MDSKQQYNYILEQSLKIYITEQSAFNIFKYIVYPYTDNTYYWSKKTTVEEIQGCQAFNSILF